jgi:hypothetical protein
MAGINSDFEWQCQPEAEKFLITLLESCREESKFTAELQQKLSAEASTRLFDLIDHFAIGTTPGVEEKLESCGFVFQYAAANYRLFYHPGAQLPRIALRDDSLPNIGLYINVESISDFLMVRGLHCWIEGEPYSPYRRCNVNSEGIISLWVVERRGTSAIEPTYPPTGYLDAYYAAFERWQSRPRQLQNEDECLQFAIDLAGELEELVGRNTAAWIVLDVERRYWQSRNRAGQLQKNRQDRLGIGWANHDHHTFRSSRQHFTKLVRLFETLGFFCRERFWAGAEAGWGAQVMENPNCRLVLFLDVDLQPNEIAIDFAHHPLPETNKFETIGLWCALHGDSILHSGMHHLEGQFLFDQLTHDLAGKGIAMMQPFSDFAYLKQAFTAGEIWHIAPERLKKLQQSGQINAEQAEKFHRDGAIGSHLENLQRREGYKGFNQKNVSFIIKETDPLKQASAK